jgi:hypothetical protein
MLLKRYCHSFPFMYKEYRTYYPHQKTHSTLHNPFHSWMHSYKTMKHRNHGKLVSTTLVVNMLGASLAQLMTGVCMLEIYINAINFSTNLHITKQVGTLLEI